MLISLMVFLKHENQITKLENEIKMLKNSYIE